MPKRTPAPQAELVSYADLIATLSDCANETTSDPELTTAQLAVVLCEHPTLLREISLEELAGDIVEDLTEQRAFYRAAPLIGAGLLGRLEFVARRRLTEDVSRELARRALTSAALGTA